MLKKEFEKPWDIRNDTPLVSVCIITYNHASFIRECIDGVLMQETDFCYEILIHDDVSTDATTDIIRKYAEKYPNTIISIIPEENQYAQGKRIFVRCLLPHTRGKFIALCEGDDYWTNPKKLQKQVDVLRANPDCSICFCQASVLRNGHLKEDPRFPVERGDLTYLIKNTNYKTAATMFRLNEQQKADMQNNEIFGAHFIFSIAAEHGDIFYLNGPMAVYRVHSGGVWSGLSTIDQHLMNQSSLQARIIYFTRKKKWAVRRELINQNIASSLNHSIRLLRQNQFNDAINCLLNSFQYSIRIQHIKSTIKILRQIAKKIISSLNKKCYNFCNVLIKCFVLCLAKIRGNGIKVYWWKGTVNFGDLITPMLLWHYGYTPIFTSRRESQLCSAGSILQELPDDYSGTILGSGFIQNTTSKGFPKAKILAVRGKRTWEILGQPQNVILGDPGLLIARCIQRKSKAPKYKIGIIPHYIDTSSPTIILMKKRLKNECVTFINAKQNPRSVASSILNCEHILSSSLHGVIFADSLGVPNAWIKLSDNITGGSFKFYDYNSALGVVQNSVTLTGKEAIEELANYTTKKPQDRIKEVADNLEAVFLLYLSRNITENDQIQ